MRSALARKVRPHVRCANDRPSALLSIVTASRLRRLGRDSWGIARPYWFSEDRWRALGLLAIVIGLALSMVYLHVPLNGWKNTFYNALQDKNYEVFVRQVVRFSGLAIAYIVVAVYQLYLNQTLVIRWRQWLTDRYLRAWLADRAYYRTQLAGGESDNPTNVSRRTFDENTSRSTVARPTSFAGSGSASPALCATGGESCGARSGSRG